MKSILHLLFVTLLFIGCDKDSENNSNLLCEGADPAKINVRVHNTSSYEIKNFNYDNIQTFSSIEPGEITNYMQLESSWDQPVFREMTIDDKLISLNLIDILGLTTLEQGCYTYLLHAYEYGEGEFITGGHIYANDVLINFNPNSEDCAELEKSDCNPQPDKVNIRIKNSTAFDYCTVEIDMNSQEHVIYGDIAAGETTCYISLDQAKEYPLSCKLFLGDDEYIIENPSYHDRLEELSSGFYTYNISILRPIVKQAHIQMSNN